MKLIKTIGMFLWLKIQEIFIAPILWIFEGVRTIKLGCPKFSNEVKALWIGYIIIVLAAVIFDTNYHFLVGGSLALKIIFGYLILPGMLYGLALMFATLCYGFYCIAPDIYFCIQYFIFTNWMEANMLTGRKQYFQVHIKTSCRYYIYFVAKEKLSKINWALRKLPLEVRQMNINNIYYMRLPQRTILSRRKFNKTINFLYGDVK